MATCAAQDGVLLYLLVRALHLLQNGHRPAIGVSVHGALSWGLQPPPAAEMWQLGGGPPLWALSTLLGYSSAYCCVHTREV